jgi:hypothetical protein
MSDMRVRCDDDGLAYIKEKGGFESEVHKIEMLQIPDIQAMKDSKIAVPKQYQQQAIPVRVVTLFLVNNPDGMFMWADSAKCKRITA